MPDALSRMPDLAALALLISVAETGSLGRAASLAGISQPAASLRMRALEARIGVALLNRSPTGSRVTDAGRSVVEQARSLIDAAAEFTRRTEALTRSGQEQLRIASSLTIADHLLPGWLAALHLAMPGVRVALQPANSERVVELVLAGAAQLGFVEGADAPAGIRSTVLRDDDLVLVVAPSHRWARRRRGVTARELASAPLVLREPGSGTREVLDRALERHGLSVRAALEFGSTESIKSTVAGGSEGAVLSVLTVGSELASGALVAVPTPDLELRRRLRAVWRDGRRPGGAAGVLLSLALPSG